MSANLFGERFYSERVPAWHRLGHVSEEETGAVAAFEKIGPYTVNLRGLRLTDGTPIDHKAIVRSKTSDDPHKRIFNVVSNKYHLVSPQDICELWDTKVGRPVETFGVLGKGEKIFITTKLPGMDVCGDEVDNYLIAVSPMTGGEAAKLIVAPIRVVCQNTLIAAQGASTEVYRIIHDKHIKERMGQWMNTIYERSEQKMEGLKEAFDVLAKHKVTKGDVKKVIDASYPFPNAPRNNVSEEMFADRQQAYSVGIERITKRRDTVRELLGGSGTGLDTKACKGTAWGLYNAVVEAEDFARRGLRTDSIDRSLLFGDRASVKATAYTKALELAS